MKLITAIFFTLSLCLVPVAGGTPYGSEKAIPIEKLIEIVRAEDELRFDRTLESFLKNEDAALRRRAALAAGRIGDPSALPLLTHLMLKDADESVRRMAAFAVGEVESVKGADAVIKVLGDASAPAGVRAAAIEAAGKIAAAEPKQTEAKALGEAVLDALEREARLVSEEQDREVVRLGITAVLRSKPDEGGIVVARFLTNIDDRIRADAANTLARIGAKNANKQLQAMLLTDEYPVARANAARALAAGGDRSAINMVLEAATTDPDLRVRVNAVRALEVFAEPGTANRLLERAEKVLAAYKSSKHDNPAEENELLTLVSALGVILKGTANERAVKLLDEFRRRNRYASPEAAVALVRISPKAFMNTDYKPQSEYDWRATSSVARGFGESTELEETEEVRQFRKAALEGLGNLVGDMVSGEDVPDKSFPDVLRAYAKFKPADLAQVLRSSLTQDDVIIRATAAELLGGIEPDRAGGKTLENHRALAAALRAAEDDRLNDAVLAILEALGKQYQMLKDDKTVKSDLLAPVKRALGSPDYLIRRKAAAVLREAKADVKIPEDISRVAFDRGRNVRSRVVRADYLKALSRKNGSWRALFETDKGEFVMELYPEDAPLTVDNFIRLAESGYFNGLAIHRVVPNFVVQDGDPRGDGSGGPGWQIRCEINRIPYERGTVGMALSGKDTGGSQWFVAHSPQPHLDGGYTVFGKVNEEGMEIVDRLVRGDRIIGVKIYGK